jgi:hypothetical protein
MRDLDRPLVQSIEECRVHVERQFTLTDRIIERASEARATNSGWKSLLAGHAHLNETTQFATSAALQKAVAAEKKGLIPPDLARKLFQLEKSQDQLNVEIDTLARLTDEGRREDALVPRKAIVETQAEMRGLLQMMSRSTTSRLETAAERIQQLATRTGWTLLVVTAVATAIGVVTWRILRRRAKAAFPTLSFQGLGALEIDLLADAPQPALGR